METGRRLEVRLVQQALDFWATQGWGADGGSAPRPGPITGRWNAQTHLSARTYLARLTSRLGLELAPMLQALKETPLGDRGVKIHRRVALDLETLAFARAMGRRETSTAPRSNPSSPRTTAPRAETQTEPPPPPTPTAPAPTPAARPPAPNPSSPSPTRGSSGWVLFGAVASLVGFGLVVAASRQAKD